MLLLVEPDHRDGAFNMALDALLADLVAGGELGPVLRLYGWRPPAVSLGRNQSLEGIDLEACRRDGIDIVRRPTGGRAVFHREELTYSVAARTDDPLLGGSAGDSYRAIAMGLGRGLRLLGVNAELVRTSTGLGTGAQTPEPGGRSASCFAASGRHELVVRGRKILGSAQRRTGGTFLQQGSLLLAQGQDAEYFAGGAVAQATTVEQELGRPVAFAEAAAAVARGCQETWGLAFEPLEMPPDRMGRAQAAAQGYLVMASGTR